MGGSLQECNSTCSRLRFSVLEKFDEIRWGRNEKRRYGNCYTSEVDRFSWEKALFSTFLKFVISEMEFSRCSLHPRTAATEKVVPSFRRSRGFLPGGCGGVQPLLEFPRRLRVKFFPSSLLTLRSMDGSDPFLIRLCRMSSG
jgi:hypothetical protein